MRRSHEDEDSSQKILAYDTILDVIAVVFDAEGQEFQDEPEQLNCVIVLVCGFVCDCVHQKWSWKWRKIGEMFGMFEKS